MMLFKQTLNTVKISNPECEQQEEEFLVDYYLVKKMYNHRRQKICYGVGIEKYLIVDGGKKSLELEEVEDISHDSDDAVRILKILYENTVTPMAIFDVLDDIMI